MVDPEWIIKVLNFLMGVYNLRVNYRFSLNPKSKIRAMYTPRNNTITFINPIETTPYHEFGHAVYHNVKLHYTTDSETFAQRFSTMWLTLNRTGFTCERCGSQAFIPAKPRDGGFYDIYLYCLRCGTKYKLEEPQKVVRHYNP